MGEGGGYKISAWMFSGKVGCLVRLLDLGIIRRLPPQYLLPICQWTAPRFNRLTQFLVGPFGAR